MRPYRTLAEEIRKALAGDAVEGMAPEHRQRVKSLAVLVLDAPQESPLEPDRERDDALATNVLKYW